MIVRETSVKPVTSLHHVHNQNVVVM